MKRTMIRGILWIAIVCGVVLVPACDFRNGRLQVDGPAMSPEVSAAISLAAQVM